MKSCKLLLLLLSRFLYYYTLTVFPVLNVHLSVVNIYGCKGLVTFVNGDVKNRVGWSFSDTFYESKTIKIAKFTIFVAIECDN